VSVCKSYTSIGVPYASSSKYFENVENIAIHCGIYKYCDISKSSYFIVVTIGYDHPITTDDTIYRYRKRYIDIFDLLRYH